MTEKTYLRDMGRLDMSAIVTAIEGGEPRVRLRLNRTIFHPQGGGQRPDTGYIDTIKVVDVQHAEDDVNHYIEGELIKP